MKPTITLNDLKNTAAGRNPSNSHLFNEVKEKKRAARKASAHVEWMKQGIESWCNGNGLEFQTEFKFHPARKYRFDFYLPDLKLGIEYMGLQSAKSGHTTLTGYTKDSDKLNLAISNGYRVLYFTVLNYKSVVQELEKFNE